MDEANLMLAELMTKFEDYFVPSQNVTFERYKFFTHDQKQGVPFDQYLAELHTLSKTCEFDTLRDSLVRDSIVCGTVDNGLRERLLRETGLTLDKCVSMCRAAETTRAQAKELRRGETTVHAKQLHDRTAKHLPMLKPGDTVRLRDIPTGTWRQKGQIAEEVAPRSYRVQTENGLSLRRNRTDLQLQLTKKDTAVQDTVQQETAESTEPTNSGPDHTDCGLTAASPSPAAERLSKLLRSPAVEGLSRPKRHVQPPKRLIESC